MSDVTPNWMTLSASIKLSSMTVSRVVEEELMKNRPISEILRKTREVLEGGNWTQGKNARTAEGEHCLVESVHAQTYCLQGAVMKAVGFSENCVYGAQPSKLAAISKTLVYLTDFMRQEAMMGEDDSPISWNDQSERTYEDVALMLKRAQVEAEINNK